MNRRQLLKAGSVAAVAPLLFPRPYLAQSTGLPPAGSDGWVSLLNGRDLTGWYSVLEHSGKGVADKRNMVMMEEEMLHIMGNPEGAPPAEPGYLATSGEYENTYSPRIQVGYEEVCSSHLLEAR